MRELLHRHLNGPADRLFAHFDESVTLEHHLELAAKIGAGHPSAICVAGPAEAEGGIRTLVVQKLLCSIAAALDLPAIASSADPTSAGAGTSLRRFARDLTAFMGDRYEVGPAEGDAHLMCLLEPGWCGSPEPGPRWDDDLDAGSFGSEWHGDPGRVGEARARSARALTRLVAFQHVPEPLLEVLCGSLKPRHWFLKRGALYGSADLLRVLIAALRLGHTGLEEYTRDVCDRLLRHLEVRRSEWLPFRGESQPADACEPLERVRFTLALLDAAEHFGDLRLLNASLKANDWHLQLLRSRSMGRLSAGRPANAAMLQLHYLHGLARQERMLQERFGS